VRDDPHGEFRALGETPDERMTSLFTGGYRIHTTVDPACSGIAEEAVAADPQPERGPQRRGGRDRPGTGAIRALVGGRDFYDPDDPMAASTSPPRHATAGQFVQADRAGAALERGVSLDRVFPGGSLRAASSELPDPWTPCNYGGTSDGPLTLREATVRSVNTVYARLGMEIGRRPSWRWPGPWGSTDSTQPGDGARAPTRSPQVEMAGAYGAFANRGPLHAPPT
jgi:membrane peptidoglycan carboxypeptidase